jgi:hypothetical protein
VNDKLWGRGTKGCWRCSGAVLEISIAINTAYGVLITETRDEKAPGTPYVAPGAGISMTETGHDFAEGTETIT